MTNRSWSYALAATLASVLVSLQPASAQVGKTQALTAIAGAYAPNPSGLYGTDLGWAFEHDNMLWMMFGDSWRSATDRDLNNLWGDDVLGWISLDTYPSGASVESMLTRRTANPLRTWDFRNDPTARILEVVPRNQAQAITLYPQGGGLPIGMGPGFTPLTGFSNGRLDATAGVFGLFFRNAHLRCGAGCGDGFVCDNDKMGLCVEDGQLGTTVLSTACVVGKTPPHSRCRRCVEVPGGLCQDRSSSMYDSTPRGRASAVVMTQQVGCATDSNNFSRTEPSLSFDVKPWNTNKFFNAASRTVNDFDRSRAGGVGNDYRTASGASSPRKGVFVWGRPHFGGLVKADRDVQLYLAWVPMPSYGTNGNFTWDPDYFAGFEAGRPKFSKKQTEAVALNLSGPKDGGASEVHDVVGQMNMTWVEGLKRWVMIYGGGLSAQFGGLIFGEDWAAMADKENAGPLYVRTAEHPWGPWSAPRTFVDAGNAQEGTGLYKAGQILHNPQCKALGGGDACVASESAWSNQGGLYAPNVIEPWTVQNGSTFELYWTVSTWNPYEVVLMKTTLSANDLL